jgi:uncharacterized protein CbrC (UPF0167 family)
MTVALLVDTGAEGGYLPRHLGYFAAVSEYAQYPGGESFKPWQDHEWPEHCSVPATSIGEIGERELAAMSGGDIERFLREHDTERSEGLITLDMVPPHAPAEGEAWDGTIHHFRSTKCGWDLLLSDAN